MQKILATLFFGIALVTGANAQTTDQGGNPDAGLTPIDHIVAVVNDDVILRSELDDAMERIHRQFQGQQLPPDNVLEKQVLDRLVLLKLQVQAAQQNGIRVSDGDVDDALQRMAAQNNITIQQLRDTITNEGLSFAEFRDSIHDQLVSERMRDRVAKDRSDVSESEIDIQLQQQPDSDREYHLATILIGVPDAASPQQLQESQAKAQRVYREIQQGRDFSQAAIAESSAQNALQGGDLGWRRSEEIPSQFAELVRSLKPGEVARPIRAAGGFYILKLVDSRKAPPVMVTEKRARHILIRPDELTSDQQAYQQIVDIRKKIVSGEADFAEMAKEHSDDLVTGAKGGNTGWFGPGEYGSRFDEILAGLEPGEISQPFRSEAGWHIVQLLERRQADVTEKRKRERARQAILDRKRDEEIETWLRQLRAQAYVDERLEG